MIPTNEFQTQLTDEFLETLTKEEKEELLEYLNSIQFIQNLISPDRRRAKDMPRDESGKIIVDITNPHILEDMEYFRPVGNHYKKHGCYTFLTPNDNPSSPYGKWLATELDRIWNGMVRPSDGEWVPGELYFYLNYCPIKLSKIVGKSKEALRVTDFPEIWEANYLFFHYLTKARKEGKHGVLIARRGLGKSFSLASTLARLFVCGDNEDVCQEVLGVVTAYQKEYLVKDGILNKFVSIIDFLADCKGKGLHFPSARYKSSLNDMDWVMGYQDANSASKDIKGTRNEVLGVSSKDNSDNLRGKRCTKLIYEEFGRFPQFINTWNTNIYNVQESDYAFGQQIAVGTGGTEGSDFSGALEIIYHPAGYFVKDLPNVFDKGSTGNTQAVLFLGAYMNPKGFYNEDGVTDVVGALLAEIRSRITIKYNSSDPMSITQRKAEMPFTIQEAVMKKDSTIYPVADLNDRLNEIDQNPKFIEDLWIGELSFKNSKIQYQPNADKLPILDFPHKNNKLEGAVIIKALPVKDSSGSVPRGRYIGGLDPYDDDMSNTMSLGSLYILDLWTDDLVFEYTGRPMFAEEFYENCRRALLFYNAECNYENNKKGLFTYFSTRNCLYLLSDTLDFLRDKEMVKGYLYGNKAHPYSQKVYTPEGIKSWGDIKIGDKLFTTRGDITKVIDIPFDNVADIYTITLKDGRQVQASANHLWKVVDWNNKTKVVTTLELQKGFRSKGKYKEYKYYIPANKGASYPEVEVKMPPYLLGMLLGDGCFTQSKGNQAYFTSSITDAASYQAILAEQGYDFIWKTLDDRHHKIVFPGIERTLKEYNLHDKLSHTKFIPEAYKYNSREVRTEILKGLMDTDGCIGYGGNPEYCSVSKRLAEDVLEVSRSLGINGNLLVSHNKFGPVYKVRFYTNIPLFNLNRKRNRQKITKNRAYKTAVVSVELSHQEQAKCVTVDSYDSCYLIGDFVTTHNSKGTNTSESIKAYARRCIRDWLLKPYEQVSYEVDENDDPKEVVTTMPQLFRISFRALLKELSMWTADGNFDRHDALGMLMLLREDKLRLLGDNKFKEDNKVDLDYLGNDPYFTSNYSFMRDNYGM